MTSETSYVSFLYYWSALNELKEPSEFNFFPNYKYTHTCMYIHTCTHTHTHTCMYIFAYMYTLACMGYTLLWDKNISVE